MKLPSSSSEKHKKITLSYIPIGVKSPTCYIRNTEKNSTGMGLAHMQPTQTTFQQPPRCDITEYVVFRQNTKRTFLRDAAGIITSPSPRAQQHATSKATSRTQNGLGIQCLAKITCPRLLLGVLLSFPTYVCSTTIRLSVARSWSKRAFCTRTSCRGACSSCSCRTCR